MATLASRCDEWSQTCPEQYDPKDARDKWRSFKAEGEVTIATLFHEAKVCRDADPLIQRLEDAGLYTRNVGGGKHNIRCPWEKVHAEESKRTTTVYYSPGTDTDGGFKCEHAQCVERTHTDLGVLGDST